jgi:GT2 family glycosyltransferase
MLTASVVVSTYRRLDSLTACLDGLRSQTQPPDDVVVVVHTSDEASADLVQELALVWPELRCVRVEKHGSVAAYNLGLAIARGSIVAYVDDDAVPASDWLERIICAFELDEEIAAVGGRDIVVVDGRVLGESRRRSLARRSSAPEVGTIQWCGRMLGNHHVGAGEARDVDVLKGVNMSFRRPAVMPHGFDERLRGRGAQVHSELSICLPLRRQGLRIVYDPDIVVIHYPARRPHGDDRVELDRESVSSAAHNEALQILDYFGPVRRVVFILWGFAVGTSHSPGIAVLVRELVTRRPAAWMRFSAARHGRAVARRTRGTVRRIPAFGSPEPTGEKDVCRDRSPTTGDSYSDNDEAITG